ncbi:MAG: DEAD/DEAH box helicase [Burkholderiaceae bacterium]|nr:DEAD/DEAH box helicase [Burkholderiaceae bacterium]
MSDYHDFDHFGLDERIVAAVKEMGYTTPTPIQSKAIPIVMQGKDVMGQQPGKDQVSRYDHPAAAARDAACRRRATPYVRWCSHRRASLPIRSPRTSRSTSPRRR